MLAHHLDRARRDLADFSRAFQRDTGTPPRDYRNSSSTPSGEAGPLVQ